MREAIQQLRAVPHFHGDDEWSIDVESKVVGFSPPLDIVLQVLVHTVRYVGQRNLRIRLFAKMTDEATSEGETRVFITDNYCRFFPIGFGSWWAEGHSSDAGLGRL